MTARPPDPDADPRPDPDAASGALFVDGGNPAQRARVRDWLRFQAALCFEPVTAKRALAPDASPRAALARASRVEPPSEATLDRLSKRLEQHRAWLLPAAAPAYPERLRSLADPPSVLFGRGCASALDRPAVAIVGARAATSAGRAFARKLAADLARAGLVIVSGLARGIDAAAHVGALDADGRTVAVLACGIDRVYPAEHRGLAERIRERGCVVTEFPPETPPRAPHFPLRNRVISGLSRAVVVVEARERSGSLLTAWHALDQGREVVAVPGPVHAPTSAGPHRLIREGARLVRDAADVLEELGLDPAPGAGADVIAGGAPAGAGRPVFDLLLAESRSLDDLAAALGAAVTELRRPLLELQLAGHVRQEADGRWVAVPRGGPRPG